MKGTKVFLPLFKKIIIIKKDKSGSPQMEATTWLINLPILPLFFLPSIFSLPWTHQGMAIFSVQSPATTVLLHASHSSLLLSPVASHSLSLFLTLSLKLTLSLSHHFYTAKPNQQHLAVVQLHAPPSSAQNEVKWRTEACQPRGR